MAPAPADPAALNGTGTITTGISRAEAAADFCARHGWGQASCALLPGDASFRRYSRLLRPDGSSCLLMDAPPPLENVQPFVQVAGVLQQAGLSVPQILAADPGQGLLLLEDFGDATYTRLLAADAGAEAALYELALETLIHLHRQPPALWAEELPLYNSERLLAEMELFTAWAVPEAWRSAALTASWRALWRDLLVPVAVADSAVLGSLVPRPVPRLRPAPGLRPVLVHRDYHIDNLMQLPERAGVQACGLLDFQDALLGHPAYDVVSLLQDARRDVSPALAHRLLARYLAAFPDMDPVDFHAACRVLGTQRAFKIVGIFNRLHLRDGKPHYLRHLPRVWRLIRQNLTAGPELAPLALWWEAHQDIMTNAGAEATSV
jgi:N-acetylmuramate 1-kinase